MEGKKIKDIRYCDFPKRCRNLAVYTVDGKRFCKQHASNAALNYLLGGKERKV